MPYQQLYNKIFNKASENINSGDFLHNVINEFPYFSAAHFFLLKETANTNVEYRKTASRTALHFNNPFFLKYQLYRINKIEIVEKVEEIELVEKVKEVEAVHGIKNVPDKDELIFEPLHTTDYFASQGIKLSEEVQTNDKLGKQLRSFTDWLKTMKKVQTGKLPDGSPGIDIAVQNLAEKSNKEQEVLTEAMAEVYVQQGKTGKAQEIYRKLSLLNPAKSAYFAAKIESLKEK